LLLKIFKDNYYSPLKQSAQFKKGPLDEKEIKDLFMVNNNLIK
jgi:hypothetical protein